MRKVLITVGILILFTNSAFGLGPGESCVWFEDINHDFIGLTVPLNEKQVLGLKIIGIFIDDIKKRKNEYDLTPIGTFKATDFAFIISWANKERTGISVKLISQEIDDKTDVPDSKIS